MDRCRPRRPRLKLAAESYRVLRNQVLARDHWRCQLCGRSTNLQVHHLRARGKLGDDALDNLITLCADCHKQQHECRALWDRI
jgi:5-methylcytosine-specific restriction endonuclease McrA